MNESFGPDTTEASLTNQFLTGPGQFIVKRLMTQMAQVPAFVNLFGPYRIVNPNDETSSIDQAMRWADYPRFDWSVRQLPTINVFESDTETKESANSYVGGAVQIQVFWPPKLRRSDLTRVPATFKGAILNFFESKYTTAMLDEIPSIVRPEKVPGLNEIGKSITWSPNTEGIVESEMVPITILSVRYRIDLSRWYKFLELDGRTKEDPFSKTLNGLTGIDGEYQGTHESASDIRVRVPDKINVNE